MSDPARTNCRHFYCFECLKAWLESNNTCPTCRTQLFEETDRITEQDVEAQTGFLPPVPPRGVSRSGDLHRTLDFIIERLRELEATVSRLEEAPTSPAGVGSVAGQGNQEPPPPTEQHVDPHDQEVTEPTTDHEELSYEAILAYASEFRAEREPPTRREVTFNGNAMSRLFERLIPEPSARPDWYEGVRTRNVRYTFVVNDEMARFRYTSSERPSYLDDVPLDDNLGNIVDAYLHRQSQWASKVRTCLETVAEGTLLREVQVLMQEEVENPLAPSIYTY
ncbi:unnamed protein product [Cercospora beticola]|nr:unnamed protein product [Cercospora beticola]